MEPGTVLKPDGQPYTVFTPYARTWRQKIRNEDWNPSPLESRPSPRWLPLPPQAMPTLESLGFRPTRLVLPEPLIHRDILARYAEQRDLPAIHGTSRLGLHLRFGTLSVRELAQQAMGLSDTFINELIWRDFYQSILWYFPHTTERAFKPAYDRIEWRNNPDEFERWCQGQTGYPLVDAGMRELLGTGWMHNRVRMVVASFLTKHLLIDWRWGEAWFAKHLLDFEQASNVGAGNGPPVAGTMPRLISGSLIRTSRLANSIPRACTSGDGCPKSIKSPTPGPSWTIRWPETGPWKPTKKR